MSGASSRERHAARRSSDASSDHVGITQIVRVDRRSVERHNRFPVQIAAMWRHMRIRRRGLGRFI